jgi:Rrf2 family protein
MGKKIIAISQMSSIALGSMCIVAAANGRPISAKEIAKMISCSEYHLIKVLQKLSRGGFIASTRGPNGGFALMQEAKNISLLDIYSWMEEEDRQNTLPPAKPDLGQLLGSALYQEKCLELEADFRTYLATHNIDEYLHLVEAETNAVFQQGIV